MVKAVDPRVRGLAPTRLRHRPFHPIDGPGMCRKKIDRIDLVAGAAPQPGLQLRVATHFFEKSGHRAGLVAVARDIANAQRIGFELLLSGEGSEIKLGAETCDITAASAEDYSCGRAQKANRLRLGIALGRVPGRDVSDFVCDHAGELRLVVRQGHEPACDVNKSTRYREGVHLLGVKYGKGKFLIGKLRSPCQLLSDPIDVGGNLGIGIDATELF